MACSLEYPQRLFKLINRISLFDALLAYIDRRPAFIVPDGQLGPLNQQSLDHVGRFAAVARRKTHVERCLPLRILRVDVDAGLGHQVC